MKRFGNSEELVSTGVYLAAREAVGTRKTVTIPADQEAVITAKGCIEAIQNLGKDGLIDPNRVGIVGFSRTSWYVETALEMFPSAYDAVTSQRAVVA